MTPFKNGLQLPLSTQTVLYGDNAILALDCRNNTPNMNTDSKIDPEPDLNFYPIIFFSYTEIFFIDYSAEPTHENNITTAGIILKRHDLINNIESDQSVHYGHRSDQFVKIAEKATV